MTAQAYVTIDEQRCTAVRLQVSQRGPWVAEVDLETAPPVGPRCTLKIGRSMVLSGTIVAAQAGVFGQQRKLRLVGGAGTWGASVKARAYHNDAGVKALLVAQDVAREVGEQLGAFVPAAERLGVDYVRDSKAPASAVIEDVIGATGWWVDFAGVTHVGMRPTAPLLGEGGYQVLAYDPRDRMLTLSLDDPGQLQIGTRVTSAQLPAAQVVHEYVVQVDAQGVRTVAWCGGDGRSAGRLAGLFHAVTARVADDALFGLYRYRLISEGGDGRVMLQAVRKAAGLPDIGPISQWPGVAGIHNELTPGAEVLVAFIEGDRAQPIVTHYSGKGGEGFVPVHITIGGPAGSPAARQGDTVVVSLPPASFTGTISGAPVVGVMAFPAMNMIGTITTGSSKVDIAP